MPLTASALTVALTFAAAASDPPTTPTPAEAPRITVQAPIAETLEAWQIDSPSRRPAALPALYATFGALQALDVYSTRKAMRQGAFEANPQMRHAAKSSGTMLAVKAATGAATIYFAERAWKKNKKGAVLMMAAINGSMAAIVARNLRNAR